MANIPFQTSINRTKPWGVAGDFMDANHNHMYPLTLLVKEYEEDDVKVEVGKFAWDNGDGTCSAIGTGVPTGVVHRSLYIPITSINDGATMIVPARYPAPIADKCSILMKVSDVPTVGNKILLTILPAQLPTPQPARVSLAQPKPHSKLLPFATTKPQPASRLV